MIAEQVKILSDLATNGVDQYREMINALPVAIYTTDEEGRLTYYNAAAAKLSGRMPEMGTDQWCVTWKLFRPDGTPLPHDQCPMAVALKTGEAIAGGEYIAERPNGTRFWFTPYPAVLRDSEGRITGGINLLIDITDRKIAEKETEERFRAIFETTPECVKLLAKDGSLLHMNSSGLAMIGAPSLDSVVGKSVYELIVPEYRDQYREFNERVCNGEKGSLEFEIVGLDGVRRQMETHAAPLKRPREATVHLAVSLDVTSRKQAERWALLLSAIVDSSDDAIVSKDLNGIVTSWNKGAERLFGYSEQEAIGKPITLIIPVDRLNEEPNILSRLRRGERVDHFETIRRHKNGTLMNISLTISPVRDANNKVIGASKIARDITERKRIEAQLIASEARFRQLADSMPQIIWTARPDGFLDYYNQRWYEFTGFDREVFGDLSWEPILHPDDVQRCYDSWYTSVRSGQPYEMEYRFWDRHESRWRWFITRALPVRDEEENIVKWFGSCTDIDDQKQVQEELRHANQDLEQFAFSASHDLQEPLRTVTIYSQLLTRRYGDKLDGQALEFLGYLGGASLRMEMLVRDLLAYTQVAKFDIPAELANPNQILARTLANFGALISETGASITADPLPEIRMHNVHLQQLFQNLVGNALKYRSPERQPVVHIAADRQGSQWVFSLSDNGIGIDPQYKEKIFGLFKRLHTDDEYPGTGIGLAICKRIMDRYYGRIWVESEPGQGSTFRFALPV